jgi:DNA repair protein RecN (Recombination protein N)
MLKELHIRNYAIIRSVDIAFDNKLNIITGETGAGKSILMGALGLILGERADTRSLLNTDDKCVIEGEFEISNYHLRSFFTQNELDYDNHCILRREIAPSGKSRAFVNDTPVTLNQLKELGSQLVDIVSQHQTLALNSSDFQLNMVDAVADSQPLADAYKILFKQFRQTEKKLATLVDIEAKARLDEDYFRFIVNELNEADPAADEQITLEQSLELLSHAETIRQNAGAACGALNGEEQSIIDALRDTRNNLSQGAKHHSGLAELVKRIDSSIIELKDVAAELDAIAEGTQADPQELERIESRLQLLFNLQKKHRVNSNAELIDLKQQFEQKLQTIGSLADEIANTQHELEQQKA